MEALLVFTGLLYLVFWFTQLLDLLQKRDAEFPNPNDRLIWLVVILFVPAIGALLYLLHKPRVPVKSSPALDVDWAEVLLREKAAQGRNDAS